MGPKLVGSFLLVVVIALGSGQSTAYGAPCDGNCTDVTKNFGNCTAYIDGMVPAPPGGCCTGLTALNTVAKTEKGGPSRICSCIEAIAAQDPRPFNETRIEALYTLCNIDLSFPISEHQNCSSLS